MSTIARPTTTTIEISLTGNENENKQKAKHLQVLAQNLNLESLEILAKKSSKAGVNEKIKAYQNFM